MKDIILKDPQGNPLSINGLFDFASSISNRFPTIDGKEYEKALGDLLTCARQIVGNDTVTKRDLFHAANLAAGVEIRAHGIGNEYLPSQAIKLQKIIGALHKNLN